MEWDEAKNQANIKKHVFLSSWQKGGDDPNAIEYYDSEHSSIDEQRYICLGDVGGFLVVFVVYEDRKGNIRLISARQAEPKEKEAYYEHIRRTVGKC
nr:BrnT family toxin [Treponema sp.]